MLQGDGGAYFGIPLDGLLGHALGSDMVDQLGSDAREHILESLSGHGWWTLGKKEGRQYEVKFKGRTMFHTLLIIVETTRKDSGYETKQTSVLERPLQVQGSSPERAHEPRPPSLPLPNQRHRPDR